MQYHLRSMPSLSSKADPSAAASVQYNILVIGLCNALSRNRQPAASPLWTRPGASGKVVHQMTATWPTDALYEMHIDRQ